MIAWYHDHFWQPTRHDVPELDEARIELFKDKRLWLFDLNNTLYDHEATLEEAIHRVVLKLCEQPHLTTHTNPPDYKTMIANFKNIVSEYDHDGFDDYRTAKQHHRAQLVQLLKRSGFFERLPWFNGFIDSIANTYDEDLKAHIQPLEDVQALFALLNEHIEASGPIAVVTEGPESDKMSILSLLGLRKYVRDIKPSQREIDFDGSSKLLKANGLFQFYACTGGVEFDQTVVIGDDWKADILPALSHGVGLAIWINDKAEEAELHEPRTNVVQCRSVAYLYSMLRLHFEGRDMIED